MVRGHPTWLSTWPEWDKHSCTSALEQLPRARCFSRCRSTGCQAPLSFIEDDCFDNSGTMLGFKGHPIVLSPPFSLLSLHGGEIMHHSLVAEHEKCDGNFARLPCGGYRAADREFVCVLWQIWAKLRAFRDERVLPGQLKLLFSTSTPADNGLLVAVSLYYKASSCLPSGFGVCRSVMRWNKLSSHSHIFPFWTCWRKGKRFYCWHILGAIRGRFLLWVLHFFSLYLASHKSMKPPLCGRFFLISNKPFLTV